MDFSSFIENCDPLNLFYLELTKRYRLIVADEVQGSTS